MQNDCKNEVCNMYFACRKEAAEHNERLSSREMAADLLGISPSTLTKHELGITKCVPVDTVVMMADLYNTPELRNWYCKHECPLGADNPIATDAGSLESIAVHILRSLDETRVRNLCKQLLDIAADGKVTKDEADQLNEVQLLLDELAIAASELRIFADRGKE